MAAERTHGLIVGAAPWRDGRFLRPYLDGAAWTVFCADGGYANAVSAGLRPDFLIGDWDSGERPALDVPCVTLPAEKDVTDLQAAMDQALSMGITELLLCGCTGGRLDHTLGNVFILYYLDQQGKRGRILDDFSEMELVSAQPVSIPDRCSFFSLLNLSGRAKGVTIEHAKYCLRDAEIPCEYQYGVSNEVLPGETATVSVREGKLLLIRVF